MAINVIIDIVILLMMLTVPSLKINVVIRIIIVAALIIILIVNDYIATKKIRRLFADYRKTYESDELNLCL